MFFNVSEDNEIEPLEISELAKYKPWQLIDQITETRTVSTVSIYKDMNGNLFETMVFVVGANGDFVDELDQHTNRYKTVEQAEQGHAKTIETIMTNRCDKCRNAQAFRSEDYPTAVGTFTGHFCAPCFADLTDSGTVYGFIENQHI